MPVSGKIATEVPNPYTGVNQLYIQQHSLVYTTRRHALQFDRSAVKLTAMPVIATARTAANVRAELARQHVTQTAVTQLLNLSHSAVSRRMRGETPFRDRELQQIAQHLNIPITVLFGESEAHAS